MIFSDSDKAHVSRLGIGNVMVNGKLSQINILLKLD